MADNCANAYWQFYREQSKILEKRKIPFDNPYEKKRYIGELWIEAKKRSKEVETRVKEANARAEEANARAEKANVRAEKEIDARAFATDKIVKELEKLKNKFDCIIKDAKK